MRNGAQQNTDAHMSKNKASEVGALPSVDRTGGRGEPLPQQAELNLPDTLKQRQKESDPAYEAFLLWAMQVPNKRSNRMTAKVLDTSESNIRHWRKRYGWAVRIASVPNAEWVCLDVYRRRMDEYVGQDREERLRMALDVVMEKSGFAELRAAVRQQRTAKPSALDKVAKKEKNEVVENKMSSRLSQIEMEALDPAKYMRNLGATIRHDHLRVEDVRKQIILVDAVLGVIAQKVKSGDLEVTVKDIPSLLKARALLTGLPTEQIAVASTSHIQHDHNIGITQVVESARMQQARASGNESELVAAMKNEVNELSVILGAIPARGVIDVEAVEVVDE